MHHCVALAMKIRIIPNLKSIVTKIYAASNEFVMIVLLLLPFNFTNFVTNYTKLNKFT